MRKAIIGSVVAVALMAPAPAPAVEDRREPESCQAYNPGQPTCTLTITSDSSSGTVTGAAGFGDWIVVVKRGKKKFTIAPSSTEPEPVSFEYEIGDKVTATVKSTPGFVVAGHD
jgi:hypothetical protein